MHLLRDSSRLLRKRHIARAVLRELFHCHFWTNIQHHRVRDPSQYCCSRLFLSNRYPLVVVVIHDVQGIWQSSVPENAWQPIVLQAGEFVLIQPSYLNDCDTQMAYELWHTLLIAAFNTNFAIPACWTLALRQRGITAMLETQFIC